MSRNNKTRSIRFNKKVRYKEDFDQYTLQLYRIHRPWWLLWLLLPFLLFIKCSKDITVSCTEQNSNVAIENLSVTMEYKAHCLWGNDGLFSTDSIQLTQNTDMEGKAIFKDLPCSVFSYMFYCLSKVSFIAGSDCYADVKEKYNFHYIRNVELRMLPRREDLHVKFLDKETGDVLPDGVLIYKYIEQEEEKTDSAYADAAGVVTLPRMRYCSIVKELKGTCYGYADTVRVDIPCQHMVNVNDSTIFRLRPIKERFTFFVKNKESKQPIPDALCNVSLTHPGNGKKVANRQIKSSIDGKGIAVYDNAFVLSAIAITVNKVHYKGGQLKDSTWTVEKFKLQDDNIRTIWLEPEPYLQEFIDVDSITGKPISGVENKIKITDMKETATVTEISNSNGVFPVSAKEDARIEIFSTKNPEYKSKKLTFPKFESIKEKERNIQMQPVMETFNFRTVREEKGSTLLPDCSLRVSGSISGSLPPGNSCNGEFSVTMRKYENLTVVASKRGYITNNTKIRERDCSYLQIDQKRRDIPLKLDLPPCSGGTNTPKQTNEMKHQRSYGMGQGEGDASISGDFYSEPDFLTVYDGPDTSGKILIGPEQSVAYKFFIPFHFTKGAVTVVVRTSNNDDSSWEYVVNCPY